MKYSDLSKAEAPNYSVIEALLASEQISSRGGRPRNLAVEVSDQIARDLNRPASGLYALMDAPLRPQMSGLVSRTPSAGGYDVANEIPCILDSLRVQSKVIEAGATVAFGLQGNQAFGTELTATGAIWQVENGGADAAETDPSFGQKVMTPKSLTGNLTLSRQLLKQSGFAEGYVRRSLAKTHAIAIDLAAINGAGSGSNQPLGILQTAGIGSVVSSGTPTYAHACALEDAVGGANADFPGRAFLTNSHVRKVLRGVFKNSGSIPVWDCDEDQDELIGRRAFVSSNVPSGPSALIFGCFEFLLIAFWGNQLDIICDPFSKKKTGNVEFSTTAFCDILVAQPAAFAAIQDIT